jgi:hypothetical protein
MRSGSNNLQKLGNKALITSMTGVLSKAISNQGQGPSHDDKVYGKPIIPDSNPASR